MVRAIMGTMIQINEEKLSVESLKDIILKKDRKYAGPSVPPYGLYLSNVLYDKEIYLWVTKILVEIYLMLKS